MKGYIIWSERTIWITNNVDDIDSGSSVKFDTISEMIEEIRNNKEEYNSLELYEECNDNKQIYKRLNIDCL